MSESGEEPVNEELPDEERLEFMPRMRLRFDAHNSKAVDDRVKTLMRIGRLTPLGSEELEDPTISHYTVVKRAYKRGEIPSW